VTAVSMGKLQGVVRRFRARKGAIGLGGRSGDRVQHDRRAQGRGLNRDRQDRPWWCFHRNSVTPEAARAIPFSNRTVTSAAQETWKK
jgi:hypothetical protein